MPALINFPIDLTRSASALEGINSTLARIADALDRIQPPPPPISHVKTYIAGLGDLRYTDHQTVSKIREELAEYAEEHSLAMDSEAFLNSIMQYERDIVAAYGPHAIEELPWNKAAGGPLFQAANKAADTAGAAKAAKAAEAADQSRARATQAQTRQEQTDREPTAGAKSQAKP